MRGWLKEQDFARLRDNDHRIAWLTHDLDQSAVKSGIEIGALDNPTALPEHWTVEYVDYAPTAALQMHPHEDSVRKQQIVNVDHVWAGSGSLAVVCERCDYDFVIASHVIEHVPNVLGWFQGIFGALKPGGVFNLAIPDRRYTFDIRRKESTLGEMIEAYLHGYDKPSVRQVFDHTFDASAVAPGAPWSSDFSLDTVQRYSGELALQLAYDQSRQSVDRYFDSHCWIFTPISFLECLKGAVEIGVFPFIISDFSPTRKGEFEFYVSFRKQVDHSGSDLKNWQMSAIQHILSRTMQGL